MIRTRVGYAGGTTNNPTYKNIGDHTESLQIDFDPAIISYQNLLDTFWTNHFPCRRSFSRQYMKAVFYHNNTQKQLAEKSLQRVREAKKKKVTTKILPFTTFYRAEDYHQKYMLRLDDKLMVVINDLELTPSQFADSTLIARLNGFAGGHGDKASLQKQLTLLNFAPAFLEKLQPAVQE